MDALARAVALAQAAPSLDAACAQIRPLLADIGWLDRLIGDQCRAMARDPLHLPPLRASRVGPTRHLLLARTERLWMTVTVIDPVGEVAKEGSIHFSGRYTLCRVLGAEPLRVQGFGLRGERAVATGEAVQAPGTVIELDEQVAAWRIMPGERPVTMLRAQIAPPGPVMAHVHDPVSGARLSSSSGDEGHARSLMMLSLLRLQKRTDAAPLFEEAVAAALPHQRWAAMREYLALDTAAALPALESMATRDIDAEVRALAGATLAQAQGPTRCPA
ncbi:MAG: hypothetical protein QHC40_14215 [Sphingobium sp.]|nr:hypothetical protein [Sphingobium sp.]